MTTHRVKSWPWFFQPIRAEQKLHDLRDMRDRDYRVGDTLVLQEFDPIAGKYTGEEEQVEVTFITSNNTPCAYSSAALDKDFCILSIKLKK